MSRMAGLNGPCSRQAERPLDHRAGRSGPPAARSGAGRPAPPQLAESIKIRLQIPDFTSQFGLQPGSDRSGVAYRDVSELRSAADRSCVRFKGRSVRHHPPGHCSSPVFRDAAVTADPLGRTRFPKTGLSASRQTRCAPRGGTQGRLTPPLPPPCRPARRAISRPPARPCSPCRPRSPPGDRHRRSRPRRRTAPGPRSRSSRAR